MRKGLLVPLMLAAAGLAPSALAQPQLQRAAFSEEATVRGLEARYQAALIQERRLADDREAVLIATYERQIREARAAFDRGAVGAAAQLETARLQYADFVADVAARDSEVQALILAYQEQLRGDIGQASPEQLEALQRFADGDIEGGFNAYAEESRRRAAARRQVADNVAQQVRQADARDARQLARMGETMRANGRMTARQLLDLYVAAAELDPTHFDTWWSLAFLARDIADPAQIGRALQGMQASARTEEERLSLTLFEASELVAQSRPQEALAKLEQALSLARAVAAAAPDDVAMQRVLRNALMGAADSFVAVGRPTQVTRTLDEAIQIGERIVAMPGATDRDRGVLAIAVAEGAYGLTVDAAPRCARAREILASIQRAEDYRISVLGSCASALVHAGNVAEGIADWRELEVMYRRWAEQDATDASARQSLASVLYSIGDALEASDLSASRRALEEAVALFEARRAVDANPTSWPQLGEAHGRLGDVLAAQGDRRAALAAYRNARDRQIEIERAFPRAIGIRLFSPRIYRAYVATLLALDGPDAARPELVAGSTLQERDPEIAAELLSVIADRAVAERNHDRYLWAAAEALAAQRRETTGPERFEIAALMLRQSPQFYEFNDIAMGMARATEALAMLEPGYLSFIERYAGGGSYMTVTESEWQARVCDAHVMIGHGLRAQTRDREAEASYRRCFDVAAARAAAATNDPLRIIYGAMTVPALVGLAMTPGAGVTWAEAWAAARQVPEDQRTSWLQDMHRSIELRARLEAGRAHADAGRHREALTEFRAGVQVANAVLAAAPDLGWWLDNGAMMNEGAGRALLDSGDANAAVEEVRLALAMRRRLLELQPGDAVNAGKHAQNLDWVGFSDVERGRLTQALPLLREGLEIRQRLAAEQPQNQAAAYLVAVSMESLASVPNSGVRYRDIVTYIEGLQQRGMADQDALNLLGEARQRAASN